METPTTDLQKLLAEATKGPWSLSGVRTSAPLTVGPDHRFQHISANGDDVCAVYFEMKTGLGFNDGRLIALAPTLAARVIELEATLQSLVDEVLDLSERVVQSDVNCGRVYDYVHVDLEDIVSLKNKARAALKGGEI
jgi:hypothetical protein